MDWLSYPGVFKCELREKNWAKVGNFLRGDTGCVTKKVSRNFGERGGGFQEDGEGS